MKKIIQFYGIIVHVISIVKKIVEILNTIEQFNTKITSILKS